MPKVLPASAYSSVLNRSQVATICNFDPNYSLPIVTQVSLPKKFQIVATRPAENIFGQNAQTPR